MKGAARGGTFRRECAQADAALLTENHLYEKAYIRWCRSTDYDYLKTEWRVSLCSYAIADHGYEEDDFLLGFAEKAPSGRENTAMSC